MLRAKDLLEAAYWYARRITATTDLDSPSNRALAREMAERVRTKFGTNFGVATTGYAGPTGGPRSPMAAVSMRSSTKAMPQRQFARPLPPSAACG